MNIKYKIMEMIDLKENVYNKQNGILVGILSHRSEYGILI